MASYERKLELLAKGDDLTTAEIAELEQPYVAINGHTMVAPVRFLHRKFDNSTIAYQSSANAHCVDNCAACNAGEYLPEDW